MQEAIASRHNRFSSGQVVPKLTEALSGPHKCLLEVHRLPTSLIHSLTRSLTRSLTHSLAWRARESERCLIQDGVLNMLSMVDEVLMQLDCWPDDHTFKWGQNGFNLRANLVSRLLPIVCTGSCPATLREWRRCDVLMGCRCWQ